MSTDKDMQVDYTIEVEGLNLVIECDKKDDMAAKFRALRYYAGMNRREFSDWLHIPYPTMYDWEAGNRKMPEYVFELIAYKVSREKTEGKGYTREWINQRISDRGF